MLGLIIVVAVSAVAGYFSFAAWGLGWGITCGILTMLLVWLILSLLLRRFVMARQFAIQNIMQEAQNKANRQLEIFYRKRVSDEKAIRRELESIQFKAIRASLAELEGYKKFYIWNAMLPKQVNAMKVQLYYQLREYDKVDELLPKALLMDVQSLSIKLARMYKNNDPQIDKFFRRKCWRFRGESGAFIACVYAWIKLKQESVDAALEALNNAKKFSDHQTLLDNIDVLTNGKAKHFNNAGFGDSWYVLALEEPKVKKQRQQVGRPF